MKSFALYRKNPISKSAEAVGRIDDSAWLGKSPKADIQLHHLRCAGAHALIEMEDENFRITDLGSHYGTRISGKKIVEARLAPKTPFTLGDELFWIDEAPDHLLIEEERIPTSPHSQSSAQEAGEEKVLQGSLYWGDELLDERLFEAGSLITLGTQKSSTFSVTFSDRRLNMTPYPVAHFHGGELKLKVPSEATGLIWKKNKVISLDRIRHLDPNHNRFKLRQLELTLSPEDQAEIQIGEMSLSLKFVARPESLPRTNPEPIDRTLSWVASGVFLFYLSLIAVFSWVSPPPPKQELFQDIPVPLKRVLFDAGIENALKKQRSAIGQLAQLEGGRARGEEGKASANQQERVTKHTQKSKTKAKSKFKNRKALKTLSVSRKSSRKSQSADEGLDFDAAFGGKVSASNLKVDAIVGKSRNGNAAGTLASNGFARGTHGNGSGGGGESVGIGSLKGAGSGGGLGNGDLGLSPSKGRELKSSSGLDEVVILGGLDPEIIAQYVKRYLPQIRNCYEQQLATNPQLQGKVTASFVIGPDGNVRASTVAESSLRHGPTEACMMKRILTWKFPKPRGGGSVGVKYPFLLTSNSGK